MKNKKGPLVAVAGGVVLSVIGMSFAVSQNSTVLNNQFEIGNYEVVATEIFSSPSNWQTCETVAKEITATNNSDLAVAVRIKLEEDWIAADGTTHLPLVSTTSGLTMAQINFAENSGWTKDGGYYYYDANLQPNATTSTLITGVTLNCDANLDISENAEATSDGVYAGATYHLKASVESIQPEAAEYWHLLYSEVASRTKGILTNETLTYRHNNQKGSGDGVFTYSPSLGGQYPIYYYRGSMNNENSLIFAGYCWRILRTTNTGGVKIIYAGVPTGSDDNRQCATVSESINNTKYKFNDVSYHASSALYMYGDDDADLPSEVGVTLSSQSEVVTFYKGAHLSNGVYTFDDSITGPYSEIKEQMLLGGYRYTCLNETNGQCTSVGFVGNISYGGSNKKYSYYDITGSVKPRQLLDASLFKDTHSSLAKQTVESWFESNLSSYEDKLEDAPFCVERDILRLTDRYVNISASLIGHNDYLVYARNDAEYLWSGHYIVPSLECYYRGDNYTKNPSTEGNGMLEYSVGLVTADEAALAGAMRGGGSSATYLSSENMWTMSPATFATTGNGYASIVSFDGSMYENYPASTWNINPVVSLKPGTRYTRGTGAYTDPFIVE